MSKSTNISLAWYHQLSVRLLLFFTLLLVCMAITYNQVSGTFFATTQHQLIADAKTNIHAARQQVFSEMEGLSRGIIRQHTEKLLAEQFHFFATTAACHSLTTAEELIEFCLHNPDYQRLALRKFGVYGYTNASVMNKEQLICVAHENKSVLGKNLFTMVEGLSAEAQKLQNSDLFVTHWKNLQSGGITYRQTATFRPQEIPDHLQDKYAYQCWGRFKGIDFVVETTTYIDEFRNSLQTIDAKEKAVVQSIIDNVEKSRLSLKELFWELNLLLISLAFLLTIWFQRRNISRPLATILQGLTNFGDGQLETTIKIASRDEFHLIACQSNQMASNLHKTMYELEELNSTLEEKVKERTAAYAHQKERAEKLLLNILPHSIAQTLQESPDKIIVDDYAQVSIIFSDFVGFTRISETVTPEKLVRELNEIFGELDEICEKFHVEKIKTIGDSYMAAAGLPERTDSHPVDAVSFALAICEVMERRLKNPENLPFRVRVGVHTGPVVAGVIGQRKFAYDLWGDTVNIASRLESYSKSGRVNISETTWRMVREQFDCIERGEIEVKGKGKMNMFFANPKKEKIHSET